MKFSRCLGGHGDPVVKSLPRGRRAPGSKPDSTEDLSCIGPVARQIIPILPNVLPLMWCESLERGMPAQVSSSSSDRGSKLRGPSQTSSRAAEKYDVIITRLNSTGPCTSYG
ncbi:hypothetical protein AVEN_89588-1 [Araneus ventricosus]|uniref:Uncharacterized protein n=1 Tax=Araneus ventricosus TaxID=182803 RepID=A0A4Y2IJW1_ARAVE|nr:hypothetical protein AVEN_89588-1 [Araneus ventricosus]